MNNVLWAIIYTVAGKYIAYYDLNASGLNPNDPRPRCGEPFKAMKLFQLLAEPLLQQGPQGLALAIPFNIMPMPGTTEHVEAELVPVMVILSDQLSGGDRRFYEDAIGQAEGMMLHERARRANIVEANSPLIMRG
jgi:hypothetical protein